MKLSELAKELVPYVLRMVNDVTGGPGPYAPSPHNLASSHHTGSISDAQAPQFLKTDGSRGLVGDLPVADGVKVDGVDVSGLKLDFEIHETADATSAHAGVGLHSHVNSSEGGQIDHGALIGRGDDDHPQYLNLTRHDVLERHPLGTVVPHDDHGALGGLGDDDHPHYYLADGSRRLSGDLLPDQPDARSVGSALYPFLKAHISELWGSRFVEETVTLFGGRMMIPKQTYTLVSLEGTTLTVKDAVSWTAGDVLVVREPGAVEYLQVAETVSGPTVTVARDLDGSGSNDWAAGTVIANLGGAGDGYVQGLGGSVPQLSVWRRVASPAHGSEERVRLGALGDLGGAGYGLAARIGAGISLWDEEGFWLEGDAGNPVFGVAGVDGKAWGGFSLDRGDIVLGENKAGSAAIRWDKSAGDFRVFGAASGLPELIIDNTGVLRAGNNAVQLRRSGLHVNDTAESNGARLSFGNENYGNLGALVGQVEDLGGGNFRRSLTASIGSIIGVGEAAIELTAHKASNSLSLRLDTTDWLIRLIGAASVSGALSVGGALSAPSGTITTLTAPTISGATSVTGALSAGGAISTPAVIKAWGEEVFTRKWNRDPYAPAQFLSGLIGAWLPNYRRYIGSGWYLPDVSGLGRNLKNTGTWAGGQWLPNMQARIQNHIVPKHTGTSYWAHAAANQLTPANHFTGACWFKSENLSGYRGLMGMGEGASGISWCIYTNGTNLYWRHWRADGTYRDIFIRSINTDWHFLAWRFWHAGLTIIFDGEEQAITHDYGEARPAVGGFSYGRYNSTAEVFWVGALGFLCFADWMDYLGTYKELYASSAPYYGQHVGSSYTLPEG